MSDKVLVERELLERIAIGANPNSTITEMEAGWKGIQELHEVLHHPIAAQSAPDEREIGEVLDDACEEFELRGLHDLPAYKRLKALHVSAAWQRAQSASADSDPNAPWLTLAHSICSDSGIEPGHITERLEKLREKQSAPAGAVQWWLAKLDRYGNPTLTDGMHPDQAGANRAFYLHGSFGFTDGERYAVAKVELFEPVADSAGVNHEAVAIVQASLAASTQPAARQEQGDEVRELRALLKRVRLNVPQLFGMPGLLGDIDAALSAGAESKA